MNEHKIVLGSVLALSPQQDSARKDHTEEPHQNLSRASELEQSSATEAGCQNRRMMSKPEQGVKIRALHLSVSERSTRMFRIDTSPDTFIRPQDLFAGVSKWHPICLLALVLS